MHFYIEGHKCILIFELTPLKCIIFTYKINYFITYPLKKTYMG